MQKPIKIKGGLLKYDPIKITKYFFKLVQGPLSFQLKKPGDLSTLWECFQWHSRCTRVEVIISLVGVARPRGIGR